MDEVQAKRETVVITKQGKPVAKLVPVDPQGDDVFGFLRGKVTITGDVVSHVVSARMGQSQVILLDTHVVLWLATDPAKLSGKARSVIEDARKQWRRTGNFPISPSWN
jgi:antitoxin (DNA-binding transcriptional repressor) of toxin-antitoxin stability system